VDGRGSADGNLFAAADCDDASAAGRVAGETGSLVDEEENADGECGGKGFVMALLEVKNVSVRFGGLKA